MALAPFRAVSTLLLKAVDNDARIIEGTASSAAPDAAGDVLVPKGAIFDLPMPLLMQHDRRQPIGEVVDAKVTDSEITIRATIARDSGLAYVEDAWKQLLAGLVKGLSIGARPLRAEPIMNAQKQMTGIKYTAWRWLELSAVTLPMNLDASLDVVRAFDPWGAAAFAVRHDPASLARDVLEPDDRGYQATRARAVAALNASAAALYRGPSS